MNPDTRELGWSTRSGPQPPDAVARAPQRGANGTARPTADHGAALRALTTAGHERARRPDGAARPRRPGILIATLAGAAVALAVGASIAPLYRCAVTFSAPRPGAAIDLRTLRTELLDQSRRVLETQNHIDSTAWRLDWSNSTTLAVLLTSDDTKRATALLNDVAYGFIAALRERAASTRETPTETEKVLAEYAAALREDFASADAGVRTALAAMPDTNPRPDQQALLEQWEHVRNEFETTRASLADASSSLTRLRSEPDPSHGLVSAEARDAAIRADSALRNDLKELAVNLSEVRLHLLTLGAQTDPLLDALARATDGLRAVVQTANVVEDSGELAQSLARIESDRARYDESFEHFADTWRRALEQVRAGDADPMTASELDHCQELTEQLNEFSFTSAKPLTAMRSTVSAIGQLAGNNARHNVLQSNLVRAFQTLQTAHHQFEFAAGRISGTEDFRLDAARRSAYGLRRRTFARVRDIDHALERKASEEARQRHRDALRTTESIVQRTRAATDRTVDQLVELQMRLNATTETSDAFHTALRSLEVAAAKLEITRAHLNETQARLERLRAERLAGPIDVDITVESCGIVDGPINRADRFRAGGIAFGLTFLSIMLGQWWATRRR